MDMENHGQVKKTPLYDAHAAAGGKLIDFHGWMLPVQYGGGILQEHESVRTKAGLFDVSHMGEIEVSGPDSLCFLQWLLINDIAARPGKAVYSPMCYPDGGTGDDLIVYKLSDDNYLLVVNASNSDKDFQWIQDNKKGRVSVVKRSDEYAQLALQGPRAKDILQQLVSMDLDSLRTFQFANDAAAAGISLLLSRTGYTGEDGFELYCRPGEVNKLWDLLLEKGGPYGLVPVGLGARDTLRLEADLPLYGQELSETISPVMAGLKRFIKPDKGDFMGKEPLVGQLKGNIKQRLAGFEMTDRALPRTGYDIYRGAEKAGYVTSGGFFPTLKKNMGLALLDVDCAEEGNTINVKVREGLYAAKIIKLPFYKR